MCGAGGGRAGAGWAGRLGWLDWAGPTWASGLARTGPACRAGLGWAGLGLVEQAHGCARAGWAGMGLMGRHGVAALTWACRVGARRAGLGGVV